MKKLIISILILSYSLIANGQSFPVRIHFYEDKVMSDSLRVFKHDKIDNTLVEIKQENGVFNLPKLEHEKQQLIVKTKNNIVSIPYVNYEYDALDINYFTRYRNEFTKNFRDIPRSGKTFYINFYLGDIHWTNLKEKHTIKLYNLIKQL